MTEEVQSTAVSPFTWNGQTVAVVGLGYVGLPLAVALAESGRVKVVGVDINQQKIAVLQSGQDPTGEVGSERIVASKITFTDQGDLLATCAAIIVAVPTPITPDRQPDLEPIRSAARLVGQHIKSGTIVIFESTVYPGVTEEICGPIIAASSELRYGVDFFLGYSPERINPGDREHTIDKVVKVVSAQDEATLAKVASLYELVCKKGVHRAPTIKTAEAAKVIENIQRDLNIALMNELALIFKRMDIDTNAVLEAAGTKWNFHKYHPGLVGGHCIGVDPYYLTHRAQELGYEPQVILAGRHLNDSMPQVVAEMVWSRLTDQSAPRVAVVGLTFKENVNDIRNSKSFAVVEALVQRGASVLAIDPLADAESVREHYSLELSSWADCADVDAVVYLVPHAMLAEDVTTESVIAKTKPGAVVFDLRRALSQQTIVAAGRVYLTL